MLNVNYCHQKENVSLFTFPLPRLHFISFSFPLLNRKEFVRMEIRFLLFVTETKQFKFELNAPLEYIWSTDQTLFFYLLLTTDLAITVETQDS